jgi:hypothetical protein
MFETRVSSLPFSNDDVVFHDKLRNSRINNQPNRRALMKLQIIFLGLALASSQSQKPKQDEEELVLMKRGSPIHNQASNPIAAIGIFLLGACMLLV